MSVHMLFLGCLWVVRENRTKGAGVGAVAGWPPARRIRGSQRWDGWWPRSLPSSRAFLRANTWMGTPGLADTRTVTRGGRVRTDDAGCIGVDWQLNDGERGSGSTMMVRQRKQEISAWMNNVSGGRVQTVSRGFLKCCQLSSIKSSRMIATTCASMFLKKVFL